MLQNSDSCPDCGAGRVEKELNLFGVVKVFSVFACDCAELAEAKEKESWRLARVEHETAQAEAKRLKAYREAGILRGLMGTTLLSWRSREELAVPAGAVFKYAENLRANVEAGYGLTMSGTPGCGKTHLATGLVHLALEQGIGARIVCSTDLLRLLRPGEGKNTEKIEEGLKTVDLLVIDDLGKEKWSEWTEEVIYHLVNYRVNDCRATVVTTNLDQKTLEDRIGQATVDRLAQVNTPLNFEARSVRQAIRKKRENRAK